MRDNIIILAAGKSTRMKMNMSKCAIPLLGKPMILHLVDTISRTNIKNKIAVLGYDAEYIKSLLGTSIKYAYQNQQLGTGHAVHCACGELDYNEALTFIVCGDMPLLKEDTISALRDYHLYNKNDITVVSMVVEDPKRYGRMIKDHASNLLKIVEYKDANEEERKIKEVNTGVYCVNTKILPILLSQIKSNNAQNEYYLTDLIALANSNAYKVGVFQSLDPFQFTGIDDLNTLAWVEECIREDIIKKNRENGVLMINSNSIVISKDAIIEPGVIIYPNTIIMGKTLIKRDCIIGPNCEINNSEIHEKCQINNSRILNSTIYSNVNVDSFSVISKDSIVGSNSKIGKNANIECSEIPNDSIIKDYEIIKQ